jgi:Amt family ammonium transporter
VVAGLVAITPASGFVGLGGALAIGLGAAALPYFAVAFLKTRFGYDDTLDAFGVHGVGGIWGSLATGLFASKEINTAGADGLFLGGGFKLLGVQAASTAITIVFAFAASYALLLLVKATLGLRVSEHEERVGLDLSQHREAGYTLVD